MENFFKENCVAIIATTAALVSAIMAFTSYQYNKQLSQAVLSLVKVTAVNKIEDTQITTTLLFTLQNTGKESLKIRDFKLGHVDFKTKVFKQIRSNPIFYPLYGEAQVTHRSYLSVNNTHGKDQKDIKKIIGKHAFILNVKYAGSINTKEERIMKCFLKYEGDNTLPLLTKEEYREIESKLPEEFKSSY